MASKISIIIPAFNAIHFIDKAIKSSLEQEEVKEVIVIDDGSRDGTYEIVKEISDSNSRVKLLTHPDRANKGPAVSRNLGVSHASSELISFLDADDYFKPGRFKYALEKFENDPDLEALYEPALNTSVDKRFESYYIDSFPKINGSYYLMFLKDTPDMNPLDRWFSDGGFYGMICLTIKKSSFLELGGFDEHMFFAQDKDLHFRIAKHLNVIYETATDDVKIVRQWHSSNMSWDDSRRQPYVKYLFKKHIDIIKDLKLHESKINFIKAYLLSDKFGSSRMSRYFKYFYNFVMLFKREPRIYKTVMIEGLKRLQSLKDVKQ